MSDISMYSGQDCPLKEKCYRVSAPKGIMQSYFIGPPFNKDSKEAEDEYLICDYFMEIWKTSK